MKAAATEATASLDEVTRTEELAQRAHRMPDYVLQNEALTTLSRALAESPHSILQTLCLVLQKVCRADSAGVSLLEQTDQGPAFF